MSDSSQGKGKLLVVRVEIVVLKEILDCHVDLGTGGEERGQYVVEEVRDYGYNSSEPGMMMCQGRFGKKPWFWVAI